MTSTAAPNVALAESPTVPTVAEQADRLRQLDGELDAWHAMTVRIVELVAEVVGTGIVETVEGLPLDHWLRLRARMIHADAASLVTAADVLPALPVTWGLFQRGVISWGTARNLATKLAARSFAERRLIDERIGATQRDWGEDLDGWSGNRLLDEVDRAIWELRDLEHLHRHEDREPSVNWLALQPSLDVRSIGDQHPVDPDHDALGTAHDQPASSDPVRGRSSFTYSSSAAART